MHINTEKKQKEVPFWDCQYQQHPFTWCNFISPKGNISVKYKIAR